MRRLVLLGVLAGLAGTAAADPTGSVTAGVQASPPGPGPTPPPAVASHEKADGRRAVRGCPVDQDCRPPHERLRDFEIEAFPKKDGDPWVDGGDDGSAAIVEPVTAPPAPAKPSDVDPKLAWMDSLALPDLPVRWDQRVIDYLLFYKNDERGRSIMREWLTAEGRYADMMTAALRKKNLPEDLVYVAMIESSFDPRDISRAGASGLWQLMPDGGRIYGLTIDRWVDERNDPIRATEAVCDYFADLYQRFGDWHLALAAYNAGYGNVIRAIARYNTNDFWSLLEYENALPWESSIYVPKAIATAIVGHNKEAFGFGDLKVDAAETWDDVTVPTSVSLAVIAKAAGTTVDAVKALNPGLRHGRTPPGKSYVIRVPKGGGDKFATRFPQLRGDWDGYDAYVVAHGERFEDVATQFGISKAKLKKLNELDDDAEVQGGTVLVVPKISEADRKKNLEKAHASLYSSGIDQKKGEPLIVPVPDKDAHIDGKRRVFYRVVSGDSLGAIARAFGVKTRELARWNGLAVDASLQPRMILQAWVSPKFDADKAHIALLDDTKILVVTRGSKEHLDLAEQRVGRVRVEYKAKKKESFEQIAKKYGLTARDLARINRKSYKTVLQPGDTIIVYQVVDKTRTDRAKKQWRATPKKRRGKKARRADAGDADRGDDDAQAAGDDADADTDTSDDADDGDAQVASDDDSDDDNTQVPAPAVTKGKGEPKPPADKAPAKKRAAAEPADADDDGPIASPDDIE